MNENSGMSPLPPPAQAQAAAMPSAADIDMSFLQQFSCMGTTDHDELVHQLQRVIGGSALSADTAKFFLEMNNWNLQGAVGSYFDFHSGNRLPSMRLLSTMPPNTDPLMPLTRFSQSWHVLNNGDDAWPAGCYLSCTGHAPNQPKPPNAPLAGTAASSVAAGAPAVLTASMCSNDAAGEYRTQWQLCTSNGSIFGEILWCTYAVQAGPPGNGAAVAETSTSTAAAAAASGVGGGIVDTGMLMVGPVMGPMMEESSSQQQQQQSEDAEMC